jgi:hypothetical protein
MLQDPPSPPEPFIPIIGRRSAVVIAVVAAAVSGACASLAVPPVSGGATRPDSIELLAPCAERLILRNRSERDRRGLLSLNGRSRTRSIFIRGRDTDKNSEHASTILELQERGAAGRLTEQGASLHFDTRSLPSCWGPLPDFVPEDVSDDYMFSSALTARAPVNPGDLTWYPGVVLVSWQSPLDREGINALLRKMKASVIGSMPHAPDQEHLFNLYALWFAGDDSTASLAHNRADELERSALVRTVVLADFGIGVHPPR